MEDFCSLLDLSLAAKYDKKCERITSTARERCTKSCTISQLGVKLGRDTEQGE
jgi:hypothetical protein